ncbi:MAG: hypothetical protein HQL69_01915 [Magnetococcales bacterium]|nr:hypothetical protein [Magnetococcales bacterium]
MGKIYNNKSILMMVICLLTFPVLWQEADAGRWKSLSEDKLHDPAGPAFKELQSPEEALSMFPKDAVGNKVRWVDALRDGYINPRSSILPGTEIKVLDMDIVYDRTGDQKFVLFPHKSHTEWLDCSNCHERIFKEKFRGTPMTMLEILQGNYCGQCHGAVSFPLTECYRCHSVNPSTFKGKIGVQKSNQSEK